MVLIGSLSETVFELRQIKPELKPEPRVGPYSL